MIALRRRLRRDDAGVTLVETLIVMVLSSLLMSITVGFFVSVTMQTMKSESIRRSTADASNIMNVVSTAIRASVNNAVESSTTPDPAIVAASPTSVTVISYSDAGVTGTVGNVFETPLRLRYRVDTEGRMVEDRWAATKNTKGYAVFPAMTVDPDSTRILGNVVVNSSSDALFRYYDSSGAQLGGSGDLTLAQRTAVTSVRFVVQVQSDQSQEIVELDNMIGMPNMYLATGS
ncbi:MAG: prepilin-type N-terminal cleavage/methylation domain-containing protein [Protaetiibacter sp.]